MNAPSDAGVRRRRRCFEAGPHARDVFIVADIWPSHFTGSHLTVFHSRQASCAYEESATIWSPFFSCRMTTCIWYGKRERPQSGTVRRKRSVLLHISGTVEYGRPQATANCYIWLARWFFWRLAVASHVYYWLAMATVQHGWLVRPRRLKCHKSC